MLGEIIGKLAQPIFGATGVGNKKPIFVRAIGIVNAERLPAPAKIQPIFAADGVGKIACWQRAGRRIICHSRRRGLALMHRLKKWREPSGMMMLIRAWDILITLNLVSGCLFGGANYV